MKCTHCGKELSDTAKFCDACAHPTAAGVQASQTPVTPGSAPTKESRTALIVVFCIVGFFVVIAIIAIFSSIVLISLNSARQKGKDAQAKANVMRIPALLELHAAEAPGMPSFGTSVTCNTGAFADPQIQQIMGSLIADDRHPVCYAHGSTYAISVDMVSPKTTYCVDSTAHAGSDGIATDDSVQAQCKF